jgi:drug/metabolite transporter (DMT)-like permease
MAAIPAQVTTQQRTFGISGDVLAATMWGFTGIIVIYSKTAPFVLTFYRLWISVALMLVALLLRRRSLSWKVLIRAAPSGVLLGANLACYVFAFKLTTIADASVIGALQPALVLIAASLLLREAVGVREVALTATAIVAVAGVVVGTSVSIGVHEKGDLIAVAGTLAFAGYWLFAKSARHQIPTFEFMAGVWISAAIALTPIALLSGESFTAVPARNWPWIIALAIVPGVGHVMMNWGHRFVDASVSSVIALLNAPVAAVAALVILRQALSLFQVVCGSVAVVAIALVAKGRSRHPGDGIDPVAITDGTPSAPTDVGARRSARKD